MPRVSTIALIALDEFQHATEEPGEPMIAASLAEHPDWPELGMRRKAIPANVAGIELHPGTVLPLEEVAFLWINPFGRLVCVQWTRECTTEELASTDWAAHWRNSWKAVEDAWAEISAAHALPKQDWIFAFSVAEGSTDEIGATRQRAMALTADGARVESDGMSAALGWNGGLVARDTGRSETDLGAIVAIASIMSVRWQVETHALRRIRRLLGSDQPTELRDRETASIVAAARHVYHAQTTLEPAVFCIYESDKLVARVFEDGWKSSQLTDRVGTAIERISEANELETRIQMRSVGRSQERSLFLLTVIGVCGTLAGVLSAVDFRNAIFSSEPMRVGMIFLGTVALAVMAILAQRARTKG